MAPSDRDYDFISPFTLPVQTGNNNDVPESSLSSHVHAPGFNFDDDDECVFITATPIDDDDVDTYVDSDAGSPSSLPAIRFANVEGAARSTTTTTTYPSGPHRPHGFDWSLPSPYEEDAISSAHTTVASSPELTAAFDVQYGRSPSTTRRFDNLLSMAPTQQPRRAHDLSPLLPPRPMADFDFTLSVAPAVATALGRPIAVGESAFSRRSGRSRAQGEPQAADAVFPASTGRQRDPMDHVLARLGVGARPARLSGDSVVGDATRMAARFPAEYPVSVPSRLWLDYYTAYPPHFYGRRGGAPW